MTLTDLPGNLGGGNPLTTWLNRIRRAIARRTLLPGIGYKVRQTEGGTVMEILPGSGGSAKFANLYIVKSAMPNYLVCRTYDGTTEGSEDVNVCKPFSAQQPSEETVATILINYTYSPGPDALNDFRLAESDDFNIGISEQQVVIPYWATTGTNAIIVAIGIDHTGVDDEDGNEIKLIEVSSRCWAGPAF